MRIGSSLVLWSLLAACLVSVGCRPAAAPTASAPNVDLDWKIAPDPPSAGPVRLSLTLTDKATGRPLPGAAVRLEGDMSHPGMQPVFGAAREVSPGTYEAPLELTMGGDWVFLVDARFPDGAILHRQVDVPGVRSARRARE